jgi:hypothetical protein
MIPSPLPDRGTFPAGRTAPEVNDAEGEPARRAGASAEKLTVGRTVQSSDALPGRGRGAYPPENRPNLKLTPHPAPSRSPLSPVLGRYRFFRGYRPRRNRLHGSKGENDGVIKRCNKVNCETKIDRLARESRAPGRLTGGGNLRLAVFSRSEIPPVNVDFSLHVWVQEQRFFENFKTFFEDLNPVFFTGRGTDGR